MRPRIQQDQRKRRYWAPTVLLALMTLPVWVWAQRSEPLPNVDIKTIDGQEINSRQLASESKWLLVYVQLHCSPCEDVLRIFKETEGRPDLFGNVRFVVGGSEAEAHRLAEKYPRLPAVFWHIDPSKQLAKELKLSGAPMIFGLRQENIEWSLAGAPVDAKTLKSIIESWRDEPLK